MSGKYEQPALAASRAGNGIAWLHGYVGSRTTQLAWLDRTVGAGTWRPGTARHVTANAPASSDTFAFVGRTTVVGFGGSRGLWVSRSSGRRWHLTLSAWTVSAVARHGASVWVAAQRCGVETPCEPVVLSAGAILSRFAARASQPAGAGSIVTLLSSGRLVAAVRDTRTGRRTVSVTTDDGANWVARELPCASPDRTGSLSGADGTLWITCLVHALGPAPGEGSDATYRSTDGGRRWTKMTRHGAEVDDVTILPITTAHAWGLEDLRGTSALVITADGGAHWSNVHVPWPMGQNAYTSYVAFVALSVDRAWALAQSNSDQGTDFTLYRTRDRGHHWIGTPLPIAANLPPAAHR